MEPPNSNPSRRQDVPDDSQAPGFDFSVNTVRKVSSGLVVDCILGANALGEGVMTKAVVDTAADVSIIAEDVCTKLGLSTHEAETFSVRCAGENLSFSITKVPSITIKIGNLKFKAQVFSGPI